MLNTAAFGHAIRQQRGKRTQTDVAGLGGPYRQLQGRIERGETIDVPDAVLRQFDGAFGWAPGTSATILHGSQEGLVPAKPTNVTTGALGHDAETGHAIGFPPRLLTTLAPKELVDAICAWPGIVIADTQAFDFADRSEAKGKNGLIPEWFLNAQIGPTVERLVALWKAAAPDHTALSSGVFVDSTDSVAIDPILKMTNSSEARSLVHALNGIHVTIPPGTDQHAYSLAWAFLFLALQSPHPDTARHALLTVDAVHATEPDDPLYRLFSPTWEDFLSQVGSSRLREFPGDSAATLLAGLSAARNLSINITLDKSTRPATPIREVPTVLFAQDISAGTLLLHNADVSPELPAVIAWAAHDPVLVIARKPAPAFPASLSQPTVIEVLSAGPYGLADTRLKPGQALLTRLPDTEHPLLTFGDDAGHPANVVLRGTANSPDHVFR